MADIALHVGTLIHRGWEEILITRDMASLAHSFQVMVTDKWGGLKDRAPIKPGQSCQLLVDGELLISGYIDIVRKNYDAKSHSITIAGRSKAGDLVDCSSEGITYNQQTLLRLVQLLSEPFGIGVTADVDYGGKFKSASIGGGETFYEFFVRMAQIRAVFITSTPTGDLIITRAGRNRIKTALKLGSNIRSSTGHFDHSKRFSSYLVRSQMDRVIFSAAKELFQQGLSKDDSIKRHRPTVRESHYPGSQLEDKVQADWQRNVAFGLSQEITYTVSGWRHADGLWNYNELVPIEDEFMGINEALLIRSVEFILDAQGTRTKLNVVRPELFDLIPLPEPTDDDYFGFSS